MFEANNLEHAKAQILALQTKLEMYEKDNAKLKAENAHFRHLLQVQDSNNDPRRNR